MTHQELIPITTQTIDNVETLACDARALYEFLGVESKFADWIKNRIEKYGFQKNIDYLAFSKNLENGGRSKEYTLSIDMAKQVAMVENNDKGTEVRRYFIKCERVAKEAVKQLKPRRSQEELNARDAARGLRMLARMKDVYPAEMCAVFAAKSIVVVTGEPIQPLLPPVMNNHETWLTPTAIGEYFGISPQKAGSLLKKSGLHGENDSEHKWSQPLWDKSPYSNKEVVSYIYDPDIIIPTLTEAPLVLRV